MNKDLTVGKPESVLWRFCLPLFGSVIFQQLYNIADSLVAGKFINESALAAVGNSYEITLIFIAFAFGCNMGCSVIVSRLFGAKEYRNMKTAVSTTFIFTAVLLAVMVIAGLLTSRELLALIHTPDDIMDASLLYLNIYIYGLPFMFFYNIATGIFSALGDSRTPFIFLAISSVSNIFVDILFVKSFQMGIAGVAWATFLCQGVSAVLAVAVVIRRLIGIKTEGRFRFFDGSILKQILVVAIPSTLAELYIHRKYYHPECYQRLRNQRYRRIFCSCQAEQSGHHLSYHTGKRYLKLYRPEYRCRQDRPYPFRLQGFLKAGLAVMYSVCVVVLHLRKMAVAALS